MTPEEEAIRKAFPSLDQKQVFFDNAGGSQVLGTVTASIRSYFEQHNVQLDASYSLSRAATTMFDDAHAVCARYLNAEADEIVLGASTTQLLRNLSTALKLTAGDEIIVSAIDHEANIAPWVDLAEQRGLVLRWWRPDHTTNPKLTASDLHSLLSPNTKLVTCTHASNILGTINDVKSIARMAHSVGALVCVDGVGYAAHRPIDVKELGVDFYCLSWYKVYGPHISMLYARQSAQHRVRSLGHYFNSPVGITGKIGLAGASYELVQSLPHVVEYLGKYDSPKWQAAIAQEEHLQGILLAYLCSRPDVTIYGERKSDAALRVSTVSFTVKGWNCNELAQAVERQSNYAVRAGHNYAERLVRDLLGRGQDGVLRVSILHYNTGKTYSFHCSYN